MNENDLKTAFIDYMKIDLGVWSSWRVGMILESSYPQQLFKDDTISNGKNKIIAHSADTYDIAKNIVNYFMNELGTDGRFDDNPDSTLVYTVKLTP